MKIKPKSRKVKLTGHFERGQFLLDKPPRPMGRLAQLNKSCQRRHDSESITLWKRLDAENASY